MSRSRRAVVALVVLTPGVLGGWAAWQAAYPLLEPVAVARLGGAGAALALWGLLGAALMGGYAIAFRLGAGLVSPAWPPAA